MPVSKLPYRVLEPTAQAIVVHGPAADDVTERWGTRVAAALADNEVIVRDVVRDLLANPQIRVIVFDRDIQDRAGWESLWDSKEFPDWRIDHEHLSLVRQFVDLYDDDFGTKGPLQPFWPVRIYYLE